MHLSYMTPLRDIFLDSRILHVTDKLVLVSSNFVTKAKEANFRMFNLLRFQMAKNAERIPPSIEYRTNIENYSLLPQSFVVLGRENCVLNGANRYRTQRKFDFFRNFAISRAEYHSLHFNANFLPQSMGRLPCIDPEFVQFELYR